MNEWTLAEGWGHTERVFWNTACVKATLNYNTDR